RIVVLVNAVIRGNAAIGASDDVEADVVERMKDRVACLEPDELIAGEDALHLRHRVQPVPLVEAAHFAEVIEADEATFEQAVSEACDLLVVRRPAPRLREVGDWI